MFELKVDTAFWHFVWLYLLRVPLPRLCASADSTILTSPYRGKICGYGRRIVPGSIFRVVYETTVGLGPTGKLNILNTTNTMFFSDHYYKFKTANFKVWILSLSKCDHSQKKGFVEEKNKISHIIEHGSELLHNPLHNACCRARDDQCCGYKYLHLYSWAPGGSPSKACFGWNLTPIWFQCGLT